MFLPVWRYSLTKLPNGSRCSGLSPQSTISDCGQEKSLRLLLNFKELKISTSTESNDTGLKRLSLSCKQITLALQVANDILASASSEIKGTKEVKTGQHFFLNKTKEVTFRIKWGTSSNFGRRKWQKVTCFSKKATFTCFYILEWNLWKREIILAINSFGNQCLQFCSISHITGNRV